MRRLFYFLSVFVLLCLALAPIGKTWAQDVQFSQFYATSMYMNPAFTGKGQWTRGYLHQRWQWPSGTVQYNTTLVGAEGYFDKARSGVGGNLLYDRVIDQSGLQFNTYEINGQYAYELPIQKRPGGNTTLRVGAQLGTRVKQLGGGFSMPSQFTDDNGFVGGQNSLDQLAGQFTMIQPDVALGALFYTKDFWIGASGHHINYPKHNFFADNRERLMARFALIGGYRFNLDNSIHNNVLVRKKDYFFIPTFHYKSQNKNDQLDLGAYLVLDWAILGSWYRGIPIKRYNGGSGDLSSIVPDNNQNHEAVVLMAGANLGPFLQVRYSYDITISRLNEMGTGGAHELHIALINDRSGKKKKPQRSMPCPDLSSGGKSWFKGKKNKKPKFK